MLQNIKYKKDCGLLTSLSQVDVPIFKSSVAVWIHTNTKKQMQPTAKQNTAFENFLSITEKEKNNLLKKMEHYRGCLLKSKRIIRQTKTIQKPEDLEVQFILLPKQSKTKDEYLFVYVQTKWKIRYAPYYIELEILFKNNHLELVQEATGLWTRLDWAYDYDKKI